MEFLSEDPTYLAGALGVLAGAFLLALRITQQGKFLIWGLATLGLAVLVMAVEWLWVTDNERIENAVYGLAAAVARSDSKAALAYLTDDVRYVRGSVSSPAALTRALTIDLIEHTRFDSLRLSQLQVNAGQQSRRGTAEFRAIAMGSMERDGTLYNFGTAGSSWSLGLKETSPGVWKVNRITPVEVPRGANFLPR